MTLGKTELLPAEMSITEGPLLYRAQMGYVMFYPQVSNSTVLCFHVENTFAFFL